MYSKQTNKEKKNHIMVLDHLPQEGNYVDWKDVINWVKLKCGFRIWDFDLFFILWSFIRSSWQHDDAVTSKPTQRSSSSVFSPFSWGIFVPLLLNCVDPSPESLLCFYSYHTTETFVISHVALQYWKSCSLTFHDTSDLWQYLWPPKEKSLLHLCPQWTIITQGFTIT